MKTGRSRASKNKSVKARMERAPRAVSAAHPKKRAAKVSAKPAAKVKTKVQPARAEAPVRGAAPAAPRKAGPQNVAPVPAGSKAGIRRKRSAAGRPKSPVTLARFAVGDVVRHKIYPFRGVIFDIDPVFANTEEWWLSIPEKVRPGKNQPYYHLLAENAETEYIAYVSEQNLVHDTTGAPVRHPQVSEYFIEDEEGHYRPVFMTMLN
jgi:heat shock protein HspQ